VWKQRHVKKLKGVESRAAKKKTKRGAKRQDRQNRRPTKEACKEREKREGREREEMVEEAKNTQRMGGRSGATDIKAGLKQQQQK
jgi:hypothetical protein